MKNRIVFGPIPSRRVGKSLGINNIPPKICSYSCIYCQIGETYLLSKERKEFYKIEEIQTQVLKKISELRKRKEEINFLSFVSDGEPTLDINLGKEIELLKEIKIPIAVFTNSSLINLKDVQEDLLKANWISIKIDTVDEKIWKKINRPHPDLNLKEILEGILEFSDKYKGSLNTETMLVEGINTNKEQIEETADFISKIKREKVYISVPTRPPAVKTIKIPKKEIIKTAYDIFLKKNLNPELLTGFSEHGFPKISNVQEEILNITSVHPLKEEDVQKILKKANKDWSLVENLIKEGEIRMVKFRKNKFFLRNLKKEIKNG
ncbi:MAG: radical SAM protein [candidate division WOR-3 bacterium]